MQLTDDNLTLLRPYIVKQLETVSEADNDVLADYVLELIKSDGDEATVQKNAKEQLGEFLEGGDAFVDNVFSAIRTKSYDPNAGKAAATAARGQGGDQAANGGGRKRSFREDEDVNMLDAGTGRWERGRDRPMKAARRGRGDFVGNARGGRGGARGGYQQQQQQQMMMPNMPMPGFNFDPSDPMAALMAMQQAMAANGMFPQQQQQQQVRKTGKRCRDYDNKGVCTRGANCPYDHGDDYQTSASTPQGEWRGRGRGRGRGDAGSHRGRGGRAEFSSAGPNHDRNVTSVVVENIPQEQFNDEAVRSFFAEFGTIEEVTLQGYKTLAIIKYADYDSAKRAYDSPKVIFDNRFVKVYWYKPETAGAQQYGQRGGRGGRGGGSYRGNHNATTGDVDMSTENPVPEFDAEAFAKQQAEAQSRFESQKAARTQRDELEAKIKAQAEERAKLMAALAQKTKGANGSPAPATSETAAENKPSSQTEALKAKLAALEAEARSIGLNPDEPASNGNEWAPRGRGRGGFVPRGRGGFRGAFRGGRGGVAGGAVKRLDNRPRGLAIIFTEGKTWGSEVDEGLKQFLLFNDQIQAAKISPHPSRQDAALLVFTERYRAEMLQVAILKAQSEIPHVGKVEVSWVANTDIPPDAFPAPPASEGAEQSVKSTWDNNGADDAMDGMDGDGNTTMEADEAPADENMRVAEVDYDVADDDARWLVG